MKRKRKDKPGRESLTDEELKENNRVLDRILSTLLGWVSATRTEPESIDYRGKGEETEGFSLLPCGECGREEGCQVKSECAKDMKGRRRLKNFIGNNGHEEVVIIKKKKINYSGWGSVPRNRVTHHHNPKLRKIKQKGE